MSNMAIPYMVRDRSVEIIFFEMGFDLSQGGPEYICQTFVIFRGVKKNLLHKIQF